MPMARYAAVRSVPNSYDRCVRANVEKIDVRLARRQHKEYCDALEKLGVKLVWIDRDDTLPDSCFVEDTAVIFEEKAVISNMSVPSRAKETLKVAGVIEEFKATHYIKSPAFIDGGDVVKMENIVLVGLSARTNSPAIMQLKRILKDSQLRIVSVKVQNVLHLKSACTYVGNNYVLLSRGHFDDAVLQGFRKIIVPREEEYAADCLSVNGVVFVAKGYRRTKKLVEREGFEVEELEMTEFRKGEGALTCLSILWQ